ncbi:MAG TPA: DUF4389 domain-containing protein [Glaciihabitans sp.]|nr:DUF4389 domain-containing protein [Glaciihabitans sp.]
MSTTHVPLNTRPFVVGGLLMLFFGTLVALTGLASLGAGIASAVAAAIQEDEGFVPFPSADLSTDTYALVSPSATIPELDANAQNAASALGSLRLRAEAANPDTSIFVGIGPRADVLDYLAGVNYDRVTSVGITPFGTNYDEVEGTATPQPPGDQTFWEMSAEGTGQQEVSIEAQSGSWVVVVMNADATARVDAELTLGVVSDLFGSAAAALIVTGLVTLLVGLGLVIFGALLLARTVPPPTEAVVPGAGYPTRLTGEHDPTLSRWLWLVKWFLAIPHYFLLAFLWFGFGVITVIAFFAILFTGKYPKPLFNYTVGVLRWNWRVLFYSYSALGTDKYPPFSLAPAPYPATFDIPYPERLSRGKVLVKWWLLAIPHLLIVSLFTSGATVWVWNAQGYNGYSATISLIALLVLIAAIVLLFTGRYPQGLFDFVLGINRWVYRVLTYTALFRDEYPPFRLDQGGKEPVLADRERERERERNTTNGRGTDQGGHGTPTG